MTNKHMKRCSASLKKCKLKPQWDSTAFLLKWLKQENIRATIGKDGEEPEHSPTTSENAKGHSYFENSLAFLKKLNVYLHVI